MGPISRLSQGRPRGVDADGAAGCAEADGGESAGEDEPADGVGVDPHAPIMAFAREEHGRTTYRPPAALADFIRARDHHCVFPGCLHRADACDIEHRNGRHIWTTPDGLQYIREPEPIAEPQPPPEPQLQRYDADDEPPPF